jgi:Family of unknown function (DUF5309)
MTVRYSQMPFYPGAFTEFNPVELPITTLLSAKGYRLKPQKQYTQTFHSNPDMLTVTPNTIGDLGVVSYGSTGHTTGSNTMQAVFEGAMVSWARMNDQELGRVLGWQDPSNQSLEPNPLDRAMADALLRTKTQYEYLAREGVYAVPSGATGTWQQRGFRYAPGITNVAAHGALVGSGTLGTLGTLTMDILNNTFQTLWSNKVNAGNRLTLVTNAVGKRQISEIYRAQFQAGYNQASRNVAGINILSIESDFGNIDILLTHTIPQDQIYVLNMDVMEMVAHPVKNGEFMFETELKPHGVAGEGMGLYSEMGVDHGPGSCHARIYGVGSAVAGGQTISAT